MARPRKWRNVCFLPEITHFGPLGTPANPQEFIRLTVEEYEAIRLIDLEGFTQEECARQMNIARTTVQGMYQVARKKVAQALVTGKYLKIEGGTYQICDGQKNLCGADQGCRQRHRHGNGPGRGRGRGPGGRQR